MTWAAPLAWTLAVAAALPLIAHLWSRKRPRVLAFPTLRFLRAASPVSRRLQHVQDWPLLLLRLAIVLVIAGAAAGPTLTSAWRQRAWHDRLHRIIVVDERVAASAARLIAEEERGAASSVVLVHDTVAGMLDDAGAAGARAARRTRTELVLIWDGTTSALTRAEVNGIPATVGLRLRAVPPAATTSRGSRTASTVIDATTADVPASQRMHAAARALQLPDSATELVVRWPTAQATGTKQAQPGITSPRPSAGVVPSAIRRALDDVAVDARVREASDRSHADDRARMPTVAGASGQTLAVSDDLAPLLRGWFEAPRLVLALDAAPTSALAWWSIVSARESLAQFERRTTTSRWPDGDLVAAQRAAPLPPTGAMPGGLDTRAAWGLALVLLLAEGAWRRRRRTHDTPDVDAQEATDAA